jgi:hypothetical protein
VNGQADEKQTKKQTRQRTGGQTVKNQRPEPVFWPARSVTSTSIALRCYNSFLRFRQLNADVEFVLKCTPKKRAVFFNLRTLYRVCCAWSRCPVVKSPVAMEYMRAHNTAIHSVTSDCAHMTANTTSSMFTNHSKTKYRQTSNNNQSVQMRTRWYFSRLTISPKVASGFSSLVWVR